MATATAEAASARRLPRWAVVGTVLAFLLLAEVLIAIQEPGPTPSSPPSYPFQEAGLVIHILLVFAVLFAAVFLQERDPVLSAFLVALSLAPLIRIFSLSMPRYWGLEPTQTLPWLAVVSVPLLTSIAAVAYVQGLRPKDLGVSFDPWRMALVQAGIGLTGIPLGFVEYEILRPAPWVATAAVLPILAGGIVIFFATGLSEELIFRGLMLRRAIASLGEMPGVLFVTLVFTSLHVFFRNGYDLAFVFLVGLFYALVVVRTKSLWGAITSHTLGNLVLYLVAPVVFGLVT